MAILRLRRTHPSWTFWFLWMLGTIGGVLLVLIVFSLLSVAMMALHGSPETGPVNEIAGAALMALNWVVIGACFGLGQWLALRRELKGAGWWILATLAGYPLGNFFPTVLPRIDNLVFGGLAMMLSFGAALGVLQWLVLRGRVLRAGWWIPISLAGWLLAFTATDVAYLTNLYVEPFDMLAAFLFPTGISGAGMVWLLQHKVHGRITELPKY
jgi:hypothetical protein